MRFVVVGVVVIACGGCAVGWAPNTTRHYGIYVDPNFTDDQANAILEAANAWQTATGSFITFQGSEHPTGDAVIAVHGLPIAGMDEKACGMTEFDGVPSDLYVANDINPTLFSITVKHELGHALGLMHTGTGTIMCADASCVSWTITCADLTQLCKVWGTFECRADQMSLCTTGQ
jgi:hypothetical protein